MCFYETVSVDSISRESSQLFLIIECEYGDIEESNEMVMDHTLFNNCYYDYSVVGRSRALLASTCCRQTEVCLHC